MPPSKYILKICLLGDGAVGKTSLVRRYVFDAFDDKYIMSFGTKVSKKSVSFDDIQTDLMIWDILGQRTHRSLHEAYYRGAAGALLVCDYTRPETMRTLSSWMDSLVSVTGDVPMSILVNKCDLEKVFTLSEVNSLAESVGAKVFETSAKTGKNVEEVFSDIARRVVEVSD